MQYSSHQNCVAKHQLIAINKSSDNGELSVLNDYHAVFKWLSVYGHSGAVRIRVNRTSLKQTSDSKHIASRCFGFGIWDESDRRHSTYVSYRRHIRGMPCCSIVNFWTRVIVCKLLRSEPRIYSAVTRCANNHSIGISNIRIITTHSSFTLNIPSS